MIKETFKRNQDYSVEEISSEFANNQDPFMLVKDVSKCESVKEQAKTFGLYRRAFHLLNEAKKVDRFVNLLESTEIGEEEKIKILGDLMNDSHMNNSAQ